MRTREAIEADIRATRDMQLPPSAMMIRLRRLDQELAFWYQENVQRVTTNNRETKKENSQ